MLLQAEAEAETLKVSPGLPGGFGGPRWILGVPVWGFLGFSEGFLALLEFWGLPIPSLVYPTPFPMSPICFWGPQSISHIPSPNWGSQL